MKTPRPHSIAVNHKILAGWLVGLSILSATGCMSKKPLTTTTTSSSVTPMGAPAQSKTFGLVENPALPGAQLDAEGNAIRQSATTGFKVDANGQLVRDANGNPIAIDVSDSPTVAQLLAKRIFSFDYDNTNFAKTDLSALAAHARYLVNHATAKIRLLGHTDERGTPEYNMALGERRAQSLQDYLVINGAKNAQIEIVSYGKEKPINDEHSEAAWAENRRVELRYDLLDPAK